MVENNQENKSFFYMIILVITLITMIIGATLAYFKLVASQKEEGTVLYTGTLQINYIDGTYIKNPELYPLNYVTYNTYKDVYRNNFSVVSSGTLDQTISVDLDVSNNEFAPNAIKYAIFNSKGEQMSTGFVPKTGSVTLAQNMFLRHDAMAQYTLIIWLDNTNYNQNFEMGNKISGKITVYAKQTRN